MIILNTQTFELIFSKCWEDGVGVECTLGRQWFAVGVWSSFTRSGSIESVCSVFFLEIGRVFSWECITLLLENRLRLANPANRVEIGDAV